MKRLKYFFFMVSAGILLHAGMLRGSDNLAAIYLLLLEDGWSAPTDLTATALSSRTIRLTWQDNADGEDGFVVELEIDGTFYPIYQVDGENRSSADLGPLVGKNFLPATTYKFRIKAYKGTAYYNATQTTDYSNIATVTTPPAPLTAPNAPANLTAVPMSTAEIYLSWVDASTDEDYFRIERNPGCSTAYAYAGAVVAGSTNFTDKNLDADKKYCYRVRAVNAMGDSAWSNEVMVATPPPSTIPLGPSNLFASVVERTGAIQLSWRDNSSTEDEFQVERSPVDNQSWQVIRTYPKNTTSGYDSELAAMTPHFYRIRAKNSFGYSNYSNEVSISSPKGVFPPLPPQDPPSAVALSSNSIRVTWLDSSTNEDSFQVGRSFSSDHTTFQVVGTVGAGVTTFDDGGLTPATTYYYMIYACNIAGCRENGLTGSATTLSPSSEVLPASPTSLAVTPVPKSSTSLRLTWQDNSSNESGFKIYRNSVQIATVNANVRTFDDTGLNPCSAYSYKVYAFNNVGNSSGSADGSATTAPAAPTGLIASAGTAIHFIFLDWNTSACAAKYHVYRINSWDIGPILADPPGQDILNPQADDPNFTPNVYTFYRVSAENGAGHEGSMSCTVSPQAAHGGATGAADTCLAAVGWAASPEPQLLTASWENFTDRIIVSWSAVQVYWDVANYSTASWAPAYQLFFDDGSGWKPVPNGNNGYILANENSANPLTFTFTSLPANYTFNFALRSVYDCGATFPGTCTLSDWAYTAGKTASSPTVNVLPAPAITASEYGLNQIYVGWSHTQGADSYKLYRASSPAGSYALRGTFDASTTRYTDVTNAYVEYWYKVSAVKNGVEGPKSISAHGSSTSF